MKIKDLRQAIETKGVPPEAVAPRLKTVSHWVLRLQRTGTYETTVPDDIAGLKKLTEFGILELVEKKTGARAKLNESGLELYRDFLANYYYS